MDTLLGIDRLRWRSPLARHRDGMVPRILARSLGVTALISVVTVLVTAVGHTGDRPRHGLGDSTPEARASVDRELAATARHIDRASVGDARVARFLGAEFGMSEEAVITEKEALGASWGNLTIAHTLASSDKQGMTARQVLQLHDRGMAWSQIAAGLHLKLNDAVRAVNAESRVARGRAKPDGRLAPIRADEF